MLDLTRHPDMPQHDGLEVLDEGSHRGINWWSCKLTRDSDRHHYTGYVELPESHPLMQLNEINRGEAEKHLHPYGGVTFNRGCVVGFDTNHRSEDSWRWCASSVREEVIELADEVARLWSLENQALVSKLASCLSIWEELREMVKRDGIRLPDLDLPWEPAIEKMHLEKEG